MLLRPGLPMPRRDFLSHVGLSQDRASSERRDFLPPVFLLPLGGGNVTPCLNFHSRIMQSLLSMMITPSSNPGVHQGCWYSTGTPCNFLRADEPAHSSALAVIVIHAHRKPFVLIHRPASSNAEGKAGPHCPLRGGDLSRDQPVQFCLTNKGLS